MIVGLGIDLVELGRIARVWERFGPRFAARILSAQELEALPASGQVGYLAARFAAKEAAAKALGTGLAKGVAFSGIEVLNLTSGRPVMSLRGQALELSRELGVKNIHLSLSHGRETAVAVVVLER